VLKRFRRPVKLSLGVVNAVADVPGRSERLVPKGALKNLDILPDSFLDGITGTALFGKLRRPGAPTELVDSRSPDEANIEFCTLLCSETPILARLLNDPGDKREQGIAAARTSAEFIDRVLKCADCGAEFVFTAGEQLFFHDKQFKSDPKRCKPCRAKLIRENASGETPLKKRETEGSDGQREGLPRSKSGTTCAIPTGRSNASRVSSASSRW